MTLYETIGGAAVIDQTVDKFYEKVLADPDLAPFFEGTNMRRMRAMQKGFLTMVLGGPVIYSGRDLNAAHARLRQIGMDERHVDRVGVLLVEALGEMGLSGDSLSPVHDLIKASKGDILADPGAELAVQVSTDDRAAAVRSICDQAAERLLAHAGADGPLAPLFQGSTALSIRRMLVDLVVRADDGTPLYDNDDLREQHRPMVMEGLNEQLFDRTLGLVETSLKEAGLSPTVVARCGVVARELRECILGGGADPAGRLVKVEERVIESLSEFLDIANCGTGVTLFRGHADAHRWLLSPTLTRLVGPQSKLNLGRLGGWAELERHVLERFKRHAEPYLSSRPTSIIDWLVLGQHHGLPTRLLDWTENPLVGMYFALSQDVGEEAVVWMLEPRYVFSMDLDLAELANVQVYFPRALDDRIISQKGCFTIQPLPDGCEPFLALDQDQHLIDEGLRSLTRIIVPNDPDLKSRLMRDVNKLGVDGSFIYPGLDGLSRQITTDVIADVVRL